MDSLKVIEGDSQGFVGEDGVPSLPTCKDPLQRNGCIGGSTTATMSSDADSELQKFSFADMERLSNEVAAAIDEQIAVDLPFVRSYNYPSDKDLPTSKNINGSATPSDAGTELSEFDLGELERLSIEVAASIDEQISVDLPFVRSYNYPTEDFQTMSNTKDSTESSDIFDELSEIKLGVLEPFSNEVVAATTDKQIGVDLPFVRSNYDLTDKDLQAFKNINDSTKPSEAANGFSEANESALEHLACEEAVVIEELIALQLKIEALKRLVGTRRQCDPNSMTHVAHQSSVVMPLEDTADTVCTAPPPALNDMKNSLRHGYTRLVADECVSLKAASATDMSERSTCSELPPYTDSLSDDDLIDVDAV